MSALADFGWTVFWAAVAVVIIGGAVYVVGLIVLGLIAFAIERVRGAVEWVGREFPYRRTPSINSPDDAHRDRFTKDNLPKPPKPPVKEDESDG